MKSIYNLQIPLSFCWIHQAYFRAVYLTFILHLFTLRFVYVYNLPAKTQLPLKKFLESDATRC